MQMFSLQGIRSADGVTEVLGVFEDGHDTGQRIGAFIAQLPAGMYHTITSTEHSLKRCEPVDIDVMVSKLSSPTKVIAHVITELPPAHISELIGAILATAPNEVLDQIWENVCRMRD